MFNPKNYYPSNEVVLAKELNDYLELVEGIATKEDVTNFFSKNFGRVSEIQETLEKEYYGNAETLTRAEKDKMMNAICVVSEILEKFHKKCYSIVA
jgi:hypothetical protein